VDGARDAASFLSEWLPRAPGDDSENTFPVSCHVHVVKPPRDTD